MRAILAFACFLSLPAFGQLHLKLEVSGDMMTVKVTDPVVYSGFVDTGAPYSGEWVSESVRTLADGTHITQPPDVIKTWRDSQGRTRTEKALAGGRSTDEAERGKFILVEIRDGVGGFYYVLDDQNKVAHRITLTPATVRRAAKAHTVTAEPAKPRNEMSSEKLGTRNIEGLMTEGTKDTFTTPVGSIGNDRPLVSTHERWYSPELKETLLSTNSDLLGGDFTNRLTNVNRAEPDPSLFMPPANYSDIDEKDSFTITLKRQ